LTSENAVLGECEVTRQKGRGVEDGQSRVGGNVLGDV